MPDLQRRLSLFSLVMAVVTSTIGSGWLFAPYLAARQATAGRLHMLGTNHRSTQALVGAVNRLFTQADRKSTRLNSSHEWISRMPSSA